MRAASFLVACGCLSSAAAFAHDTPTITVGTRVVPDEQKRVVSPIVAPIVTKITTTVECTRYCDNESVRLQLSYQGCGASCTACLARNASLAEGKKVHFHPIPPGERARLALEAINEPALHEIDPVVGLCHDAKGGSGETITSWYRLAGGGGGVLAPKELHKPVRVNFTAGSYPALPAPPLH